MIDKRVLATIDRIFEKQSELTELIETEGEYYFRFKGHAMSVLRRNQETPFGAYSLFIYPKWSGPTDHLAELLSQSSPSDVGIKMASYHGKDYGDEKLGLLYQFLESKFINVDAVFDDILSG